MMQPLVSLMAGLVFGLGLAIAEMTNPLKVLAFLDLAGDWDPSLAFVMGGAVTVTALAFRFILRRPVPFYGERFHLPTLTQIDRKLLHKVDIEEELKKGNIAVAIFASTILLFVALIVSFGLRG